MPEYVVDVLRRNPQGAPYLRTESFLTEDAALSSADRYTSDPQVIEVTVHMDTGRRSVTLSIWSRTSAGYCRATRQTKLIQSEPCGGTTLPAGVNAGNQTI